MPNVNSEKDLCRCCHSEGSYKNLYESHSWLDVEEAVYSKLIQECYSIEMAPITSSLQHTLCSICDSCIERLRDAVQFRRQVVKCEKRFRDVYIGCVGEGVTDNTDIKIKQEPEMKEDEIVVEVDPNGAHTSVHPSNHGPTLDDDDEDDDDDDSFGQDDDVGDDYSVKIEEKGPDKSVQVKKEDTASDSEDEVPLTQVKRAKKRKAPSKKAAAKKRARSNDESGLAKDIEGLEIIQGVSAIRVKTAQLHKNTDFCVIDNDYQCLRCPEKRHSDSAIRSHVKKVHLGPPEYKCPICFHSFVRIFSITKHLFEEHNIDERFKCKACSKAFFSQPALNEHSRTFHMLGEKFRCDICGFETFCRRSFKKHEVSHSNERSFKCQYCEKGFKTKYARSMHEKIHTGDKQKVCIECHKAFIDSTSLKYHMKRHHPDFIAYFASNQPSSSTHGTYT